MQPTAEDICGGLRLTSTHGVVFVGDAGLSSSVRYPNVYASLTEVYMNIYETLGVPLVNEALGIELEDDGLHLKISSQSAVLVIVNRLLCAARSTSSFSKCPPAKLWEWRQQKVQYREVVYSQRLSP